MKRAIWPLAPYQMATGVVDHPHPLSSVPGDIFYTNKFVKIVTKTMYNGSKVTMMVRLHQC